jgi:hypothetical protein
LSSYAGWFSQSQRGTGVGRGRGTNRSTMNLVNEEMARGVMQKRAKANKGKLKKQFSMRKKLTQGEKRRKKREEQFRSNIFQAMLRFRNLTGAHFDGAKHNHFAQGFVEDDDKDKGKDKGKGNDRGTDHKQR